MKQTQHTARPKASPKEPADAPQEAALVYGKNAVTELLKSGAAAETVFLQDTMNEAQAGYYTALARQAGAVVKRVRAAKLRGMCGTDSHQGVAAWGACIAYVALKDFGHKQALILKL